MKNKLLLLSAALFGAVSFGNYVHSMDQKIAFQNTPFEIKKIPYSDLSPTQKRNTCLNKLSEIVQIKSFLINKLSEIEQLKFFSINKELTNTKLRTKEINKLIENKLKATKEDFDFIFQNEDSIVYQGTVLFINHTENLYYSGLISIVEFIEFNEFVISNVVQRMKTNHEGLAKLNEALSIFSKLKKEFSSNNKEYSIFAPLFNQLGSISLFTKFNNNLEEFCRTIDSLSIDKIKYPYEKNTVEYVLKYKCFPKNYTRDKNHHDFIGELISDDESKSYLYKKFNIPNNNPNLKDLSLLDLSALYGDQQIFDHCYVHALKITDKTLECAAIGGDSDIISKCKENLKNSQEKLDLFLNNTLKMSVIFHRYNLTDWLMQNYNNCDKLILNYAIEYFNIHMFLKVAQDKSNPFYNLNNPTLLHKCCEYNRKEIAEILLIDGADVNYTDEENRKPIDVAHTDEMRDLLRQYGAN